MERRPGLLLGLLKLGCQHSSHSSKGTLTGPGADPTPEFLFPYNTQGRAGLWDV